MTYTDEATILVSESMKEILRADYSDAPKVHLYSHYLESILISILNARRLKKLEQNADPIAALERMSELGLLSPEIPAFAVVHKHSIAKLLYMAKDNVWGNPHTIHEVFLGCDLNITDTDIWFSAGKVMRDSTGSYYTPNELAVEVVREAVEKYLELHQACSGDQASKLLSKATFADLSCGCGEFIKAILSYLAVQYGIMPTSIIEHLYGVDIDPIALQITVCDLCEQMPEEQWPDVISHFVLGNPLINQPNEKSRSEKTSLYAMRRLYAADMGINIDMLFDGAGIDIIVGNPPWEKIRFEERSFFRSLHPEISEISQKNKRQDAIEQLKKSVPLSYVWYQEIKSDYERYRMMAKSHPFVSDSLNGELNTYALFTELSMHLLSRMGVLSIVVKSAIVTSPVNKPLFVQMLKQKNLVSVCLFDNTLRIFAIDAREKFCILTCSKQVHNTFELIAGSTEISDIHSLERSILSVNDVQTLNPNTCMIPSISKNQDIEILLDIHRRLPLFDDVYPNCRFGRLVHLTSHAQYIQTEPNEDNIPIYEGKFIERYDARFATFAGLPNEMKYSAKAYAKKLLQVDNRKDLPESRYFIRKELWSKISTSYPKTYMLAWRSLTSTTNTRTTLAMILPMMPTCQSIQFLQTENNKDLLMMLALFNSKPFDYLVRLKMPGIDLTQSVIRQIPVPARSNYEVQVSYQQKTMELERHILNRVSALIAMEPMIATLAQDLEYEQHLPVTSKAVLERELDELFIIAFGLSAAEKEIVQSSFRKD